MTQISVIQIIRKENIDYKKIIYDNSDFLNSVNVEYIVYDNLKSFEVLEFIKNFPNLKYIRKDFKSLKTSMLESGLIASGDKIIYLKSDDTLNMQNVEHLEKIRPNLMRKNLKKIANIKKDDFKYDDFNLLIKENKSLWEKIKILFF